METNDTKVTGYLYGAAVQGIQEFIYRTNALKDIAGASEIVEQVCTSAFREVLEAEGIEYNDESAIVMAAGNIKYIFDTKEDCAKVARIFPKKVMEMAPGITISQAVVPIHAVAPSDDFAEAVQKLESRLRTQRNRPFRSPTLGAIGIRRSRTTGLPVTQIDKGEFLDESTWKKREKYRKIENDKNPVNALLKLSRIVFGDGVKSSKVAYDVSYLADANNWIAIIHADGNGFGQVIQKVGTEKDRFREFSRNLDKATQKAARAAFDKLNEDQKHSLKDEKVYSMRPIVVSGDDLTVICRADIAVEFTKWYLDYFEQYTGKMNNPEDFTRNLKDTLSEFNVFANSKTYLSACAGITFIKSSYPFYYGYELAESLCSAAKKESKLISGGMENLPPSSLIFHRVQSSFVDDYKEIVVRELEIGKYAFNFGPYYLDLNDLTEFGKKIEAPRWSIDDLLKKVAILDRDEKGHAVKGNLRNWLTILSEDPGAAGQRKERILSQIENAELRKFAEELMTEGRTPVYDLLTLLSI